MFSFWSHGDFPSCGKIKDTQRSEMAILGNYGTRWVWDLWIYFPCISSVPPTPHPWRGGIFPHPIYSWESRGFPHPGQGPNPSCAPRTTTPVLNSLELQCKYIPLLENTLNPQMPSANIQIHWGCKYFYLQIQFTSLHGPELRLSLMHHHHHCNCKP